ADANGRQRRRGVEPAIRVSRTGAMRPAAEAALADTERGAVRVARARAGGGPWRHGSIAGTAHVHVAIVAAGDPTSATGGLGRGAGVATVVVAGVRVVALLDRDARQAVLIRGAASSAAAAPSVGARWSWGA